MPKKFAVVGEPIAKSMSPLIHNHWYKKLGIAAIYEKVAVANCEQLEKTAAAFHARGYQGFNVTVPVKGDAFELAKSHDAAAAAVRAVNTMSRRPNGWHGGNTDVHGITAALDEADKNWRHNTKKAVVIGGGGAAAAVLYALKGIDRVAVVNRTRNKAEQLVSALGLTAEVRPWAELAAAVDSADLIINATAEATDFTALDFSRTAADAIAFDLVYTVRTEFSKRATASHLRLIPGLRMLLHQAAAAFEIWLGVAPPIGETALADLLTSGDEGNRT